MQSIYQFAARTNQVYSYIDKKPIMYTFQAPPGARLVNFHTQGDDLVVCCLVDNALRQEQQTYSVVYAELGTPVDDDLVLLDERHDNGFPMFLFTKPGQLGK